MPHVQARHLTDPDLLDRAAAALRTLYDDYQRPPRIGEPVPGEPEVRQWVAECARRGLSHRQLASHARVPGRWLIHYLPGAEQRADAYRAEIHHLERELAAVRADRAADVAELTDRRGEQPHTKTAVAAMHGVSRVTLDEWIAAAGAHDLTTKEQA